MEIVLVHPEIPQNAGCAARLAAATGTKLHFVEPLGFSLESRYLKRAGLDTWPAVDLVVHPSWERAAEVLAEGSSRPLSERLRLFSARGGRSLFETRFAEDDLLLFGSESSGLPAELLAANPGRKVYIPVRQDVRSLNLANVVCLAVYTAKLSAGIPLPDNDGRWIPHDCGESRPTPSDVARRSDDS